YFRYGQGLLRGDFGVSFVGRRPALDVVLERVPSTLMLMGIALALSITIGILFGIVTALHRDTWVDRCMIGFSAIGFCLPSFLLAILLILTFGALLQILPISGNSTVWHFVMPIASLTLAHAAVYARFARSSMLEVLKQPYIRAVLARGLPR